MALQALGSVGGTFWLAAVLDVPDFAVRRNRARALSNARQWRRESCQDRRHGHDGDFHRRGSVLRCAVVLERQHALRAHACKLFHCRWAAHAGCVGLLDEQIARALGHGNPPAHAVYRLCGFDRPVRLRHGSAHRRRLFEDLGRARHTLCFGELAVPGRRHRPRRRMGLRCARLGRLLGLGPGGECEPAFVARVRGARPHVHGLSPARRVQALGCHVFVSGVHVRNRCNVHHTLGHRAVGACVLGRSRLAGAVRWLDRRVDCCSRHRDGNPLEVVRRRHGRRRRHREHVLEGCCLLFQQRDHGVVCVAAHLHDPHIGAPQVAAVRR